MKQICRYWISARWYDFLFIRAGALQLSLVREVRGRYFDSRGSRFQGLVQFKVLYPNTKPTHINSVRNYILLCKLSLSLNIINYKDFTRIRATTN